MTGNINNEDTNFISKGKKSKILEKLKLEKGDESYTFRKAILLSLVLWLPMLILTIVENTTLSSSIKIPFLGDFVVYARFFVALPMLFFTEKTIKFQTNNTINYFLDSGIIADNNIEDFQFNLKRILNLRDSRIPKVIILIIAYIIVFIFWKSFDQSYVESSWLINKQSGSDLSYAGYWYFLIAAPVYHFVLYVLIWKYLLWAVFMWKISRMKLNLFPTNPDLSAGLGFLGYSLLSFAFIGFAQSSVFSGEIANKIAFMGDTLKDNRLIIFGSVIILSFIYFFPSLFFMSKLYSSKLKGILEYGVLTSKQSLVFSQKWIKDKYNEFLDTGDFSSLTDLNTSYDIIQKMRTVPIEKRKIISIMVIIAVPYAPLLLLAFPANELFDFILNFFV